MVPGGQWGHNGENNLTCVYIGKNLSTTRKPILIKLGTNDLFFIKGIEICTNKRPDPLQKGDI
jgi:hypothetical protein